MQSASARLRTAAAPLADPRERLIVALDYPDADQAMQFVESMSGIVRWYKVGLELFLASGHDLLKSLVDQGHSVFLDLKLHDIPNTVAGAVRSAARSGASLLTIHAAGGSAMIAAAAEAAATLKNPPRLLAVTVLTSMDQEQLAAIGVSSAPSEQVRRLANLALASGADGLVCSAQEAATLRNELGAAALLVTPGIRPVGSAVGDQKRISTPEAAIKAGSSFLVVGRPITQAQHPQQAAEDILAEIRTALEKQAGSAH